MAFKLPKNQTETTAETTSGIVFEAIPLTGGRGKRETNKYAWVKDIPVGQSFVTEKTIKEAKITAAYATQKSKVGGKKLIAREVDGKVRIGRVE